MPENAIGDRKEEESETEDPEKKEGGALHSPIGNKPFHRKRERDEPLDAGKEGGSQEERERETPENRTTLVLVRRKRETTEYVGCISPEEKIPPEKTAPATEGEGEKEFSLFSG